MPQFAVATKADYLDIDSDVVAGFVQLISAATVRCYPKVLANQQDVSIVLDAMRILRPKLDALDMLDAMRHMVRKQWADAVHVFSALLERAPELPGIAVLLAACLQMLDTPDWKQRAAQTLIGNDDPDQRALVEGMLAREELGTALAKARQGGQFTMPASCLRYAFPDAYQHEPGAFKPPEPKKEPETATASASAEQFFHPSRYLRG